jgi:hypothetical protein
VSRRVSPQAKSQWSSYFHLPSARNFHSPFISGTCTPPLYWCTFAWPRVSSETSIHCLSPRSSGLILTSCCYPLKTSYLQKIINIWCFCYLPWCAFSMDAIFGPKVLECLRKSKESWEAFQCWRTAAVATAIGSDLEKCQSWINGFDCCYHYWSYRSFWNL